MLEGGLPSCMDESARKCGRVAPVTTESFAEPMDHRKVTIVIPCFNERHTILTVLSKVQALPIDKMIIVVDNHSNDGTRELLAQHFDQPHATEADPSALGRLYRPGQKLIRSGSMLLVLQPTNANKGTSLRTALMLANSQFFVCQDADLEYDPSDIVRLLSHADQTGASVVFGSRLLGSVSPRRDIYHVARVGLTRLFRLLYASPLSDVATCYKLMTTSTARALDLQSTGFDLDFEIPAKLRRLGYTIREIPVGYSPRGAEAGKKLSWKHGASAVWTLLRYRRWAPQAGRMGRKSERRDEQ